MLVFAKFLFSLLLIILISSSTSENKKYELSTSVKCACTFPNGSVLHSNGIHKRLSKYGGKYFDKELTHTSTSSLKAQFFQDVFEMIKNQTLEIYRKAINTLIALKDKAIEIIKRIKEAIENFFSGGKSEVKNETDKAKQRINIIQDFAVDKLKQLINYLLDQIRNMATAAINEIIESIKHVEEKVDKYITEHRYNYPNLTLSNTVLEDKNISMLEDEFQFGDESFKIAFNGFHGLETDIFSVKCSCSEGEL